MKAEVFIPIKGKESFCMDFDIWDKEFRDIGFWWSSDYVNFYREGKEYILHRYIMRNEIKELAEKLGKPESEIEVHHKDGREGRNNCKSNMEVMTREEHRKLEHALGNNGMKGKKHTSETKRKMGKSRTGKKNGMYGKKHSEETKRKISETKKRSTVPMEKLSYFPYLD